MDSPLCSADSAKEVFVFGSDLAGRHSGGEGLAALRRHGAVYGRGVELQERSYSIPVRDEQGKLMSAAVIARYANAFLRFAAIHREMTFDVSAWAAGEAATATTRSLRFSRMRRQTAASRVAGRG